MEPIDALEAPLSRRSFARIFGVGAALAAFPAASRAAGAPAARRLPPATVPQPDDDGIVRLSANENPYGPSPAALRAMRDSFAWACRYPDAPTAALAADLAKLHGVAAAQVLLGAGSSEILKLASAAFTAPGRPVVAAEPTFEAVLHYAGATGAEQRKVPLAPGFHHDLGAMLAAAPHPGLLYVCNPNNPTGTVTPKAALCELLSRAPASVAVLVDEAYHHYAEGADKEYESVVPLLARHPNLIVARTFSKAYGMAGLRCGYALAAPEVVAKLRAQAAWDSLNIMAIVAARASLADPTHVEDARRRTLLERGTAIADLAALGYVAIPSAANFFMVDLRRDVRPVIAAFKEQKIEVGRPFPALPTHLRVTVGTPEQMRAFLGAFRRIVV